MAIFAIQIVVKACSSCKIITRPKLVDALFLECCQVRLLYYQYRLLIVQSHATIEGRILWSISLHESIDFDTLSTNSLVVTRTDPQFFCILRSNINIFY